MTLRRATLRFPPPPPGRRLRLHGELSDWVNGLPVSPDGEVTLELSPGVYEYKLRLEPEEGEHDDGWLLPADSAQGPIRTRSRGGQRNALLSLGGTAEPLLFAPCLPFVYPEPRGGLQVTVALRRGLEGSGPISIGYREGAFAPPGEASFLWQQMEPLAEEDEHLLFRARLPCSTERVRFAFSLPDGRRVDVDEEGAPLSWDARSALAPELPEWWTRGLLYTVFVDRFRPAGEVAGELLGWGLDPGPGRHAGGHLDGVIAALEALAELGVTVIHLTPVHVGHQCHRYDVVAPDRVDPALGGEPAFRRLLAEAHVRGLRVVADLSFSHVGPDFGPWRDVLAHGRGSRYAAWFQWVDGPAAEAIGAARVRRYGGVRDGPPLLELTHPEVAAWVLETVRYWCGFELDGFRLDGAAEVPLPLATQVRALVRERRPGSVLFGELVPAHAWRWRQAGALDAATEFGFREAALRLLLAPRPAEGAPGATAAFAAELGALDAARGGPASTALRFLSTHDHPRFASLVAQTFPPDEAARRLSLGHLLLFTSPGVPALVYGEELGLAASAPEPVPEQVWANRMPLPLPSRWTPAERARLEELRALASLRRTSQALTEGALELLFAQGPLLVFRRSAGGEVLDVALNLGDLPLAFEAEDEARPRARVMASTGLAEVEGTTLTLGALTGAVFRRERRSTLALPAVETENLRRRDADFALGRSVTPARPTRLNFSLTERCNLRCLHCITHAPERTQARTARAMTPLVLDALRDDLPFAHAYAFVHEGESVLSPLLFDLLRAIREERGGLPTQVHLLTNGMLLTEPLLDALVAHGLTSLCVSLDGASARTNDSLRVGSRLETLRRNVARATRLRRARGLPLRIGLSTVVTAENLSELEALVSLAAALEVDWLKLEELAAVSEPARRYLLPATATAQAALEEALSRAASRARESGLVLVDHTRPETTFRCQASSSPALSRFHEADDYANGVPLLSCRFPWELACIEPNGDVHLGDFFGPRLGNLTEAPLQSLWSGATARAERERSVARRICARGAVTCLTGQPGPERHRD